MTKNEINNELAKIVNDLINNKDIECTLLDLMTLQAKLIDDQIQEL